jgi:hypothetical protein
LKEGKLKANNQCKDLYKGVQVKDLIMVRTKMMKWIQELQVVVMLVKMTKKMTRMKTSIVEFPDSNEILSNNLDSWLHSFTTKEVILLTHVQTEF